MKKIKLIPLMMIVPLLGACNNSGVKSMSKPKFAAYSNKVSDKSDFFDHLEKAGEEAFKANFVFDSDNKLVSLDKGASAVEKAYQAIEYKAKLNTGNKEELTLKSYAESKMEADAATLVVKATESGAQEEKAKGTLSLPGTSVAEVGSQVAVLISTLPSYTDGSISGSRSAKAENYNFFQDKKSVTADAVTKTYTKGQLEIEEKDQKALVAYTIYSGLEDEVEAYAPYGNLPVEYDRYEDGNGKVFTSVFTKEAVGLTVKYNSGKELQLTSKIERIYQIDLANFKCAYSEEIKIEMSNAKEGTYNYTSKTYRTLEFANKKVSVKAPDLAKYKDVTPSYEA